MVFQGTLPDVWKTARRDLDIFVRDERPVTGPMAPYLGRRYSTEEMWEGYLLASGSPVSADNQPIATVIRAYEVVPLLQQTFQIESVSHLSPAVHRLLVKCLPDISWPSIALRTGAVKKYGIFEVNVAAPVDESTGSPMALRLFGKLITVDGLAIDKAWFRSARHATDKRLGIMSLRVEVAIYANTQFVAVDIPFYM